MGWEISLPYHQPYDHPKGKRAIAQAVSANRVKARGPGHPCVNPPPNSPSSSMPRGYLPQRMCLETVVLTIPKHPIGPFEAKNTTGDEGTKGLNHLGLLHLHWTMVLRVTEAHYQWPLWCHPDQTIQIGQGIPDDVDGIERRHTWK